MSEVKGWGDCPTCNGLGEIWIHPGARCQTGTLNDSRDHAGDERVPCWTCEDHHAAVQAAVDAEREACAKHVESLATSTREIIASIEVMTGQTADGDQDADKALHAADVCEELAVSIRARRTP
jgi:hypothetical protein